MASPARRTRPRVLVQLAPLVLGLVAGAGISAPTAQAAPLASAAASSAASASTASAAAPAAARRRTLVRAASFNVLGSEHTRHSSQYAVGVKRARLAAKVLDANKITVLGMQEAARDQTRVLTNRGWSSYPKWRSSTDIQTAQSVLWRTTKWKRLRSRVFEIPFNRGNSREIPVVLLQHRASEKKLWVISVHLTNGGSELERRERRVGTKRVIAQVKKLRRSGHPVMLTGDMNDRRQIFCRVVGSTKLEAANGGRVGARGCRPPKGARIDWIFGSPRLESSRFRFVDTRRVDKITDHTVPMVDLRF